VPLPSDERSVTIRQIGTADLAKQSGGFNVTTASQVVLVADAARNELALVNDSDTTIYLKLQTVAGTNPTAVVSEGIRLNAAGGAWTSERFAGAVAAIHAGTGNKRLTVAEF